MSEIAKLYVTLDAKMDSFNKGMADVSKKLENVGKSMTNMGKNLTTYVTAPILAAGAGLAKSAMDLEATEAKYNTVFAGMTNEADVFLLKFKELTPATTAQARSMASGLQDLLIPMGFMREEATVMTGELMHVTGALANFNSGTHTAEQVANAMQSALLGQYMPLASLGVQLDVNTVKQKAVEQGMAATTGEVTKQQMAQIMLQEVYAQSGDALEAYTEENLDAMTKMGLMKAEIIDVAASMGTMLLPIINDVIGFVRELAETFGGLTEEQQKTILIVGAVAAALGPIVLIAGQIATAVGAIGTALGGVALGPVVLIVGAIAGLIAIFTHLWKTNESFRDAVIKIWEHIKTTGLEIWETLKTALAGVFESIKLTAEHVFGKMQEFWDKWGQTILAIAIIVWDQIKLTIETVINVIAGIIDFVMAVIRGDWEAAWGAILGILETIGKFIHDTVVNIFSAMATWMATKWEEIKTKATETWEALKTAVIEKATELHTNVVAKLEEIWDYIKSIPEQAKQWGANIIDGLWQGIKNMGATLKANVTKFIDENIPQVVKDLLGIASRSKLMFKYGGWVVQGLIEGMLAGRTELSDAAKELGDIISNSLSTVQRYVKDTVAIVQKEFRLWKLENEDLVSSSEILEKQLESQQREHELLIAEIEATVESLRLAIEVYGETSEEAMKYEMALLDLKITQAELGNTIRDTTDAMNEQTEAMLKQAEEAAKREASYQKAVSGGGVSESGITPAVLINPDGSRTFDGVNRYTDPETGETTVIDASSGIKSALSKQIEKDIAEKGYTDPSLLDRFSKFALGGIAMGPTLGLFGEAGPEAILPLAKLLPMMTDALIGAAKKVSSVTSGTTNSMSNEFHFHSPEPIDPARAARLQEKTMRKMALEWGF